MSAGWRSLRATLTDPLLAALALSAGFIGFVAWDQSHWWRVKEDYAFGWFVPVLVGFVIHDRRRQIVAAAQACASADAGRATGWAIWALRAGVGAALLGGVLLFLLGAFYRAGAGTSQPGTLAITLGAAGIVLPLIFLNAPERPTANQSAGTLAGASHAMRDGAPRSVSTKPEYQSAGRPGVLVEPLAVECARVGPSRSGLAAIAADPRVRLVGLFGFPVLVWLVSAPLVSAVESQLSLFLLRKVVAVVAFVFDVLGLAIEQQGNVLVLPRGRVGVEEACSGIRSLTACLFAGSFAAAVFLRRLSAKLALIVAALGLAFAANTARGLFLTSWAYRNGPDAIGGVVHDVAGYAVLALTVLGLVALLRVFRPAAGESRSGR